MTQHRSKPDPKPPWDRPAPKHEGAAKPMSAAEKSAARRSAKAAGRPYPNLVDNLRTLKKRGAKKSG